MARARTRIAIQDAAGNAKSTGVARFYEKGTLVVANGAITDGTPLVDDLYLSETGGSPTTQPVSADGNGMVVVYTDAPRRMDVATIVAGVATKYDRESLEPDPSSVPSTINVLSLPGVKDDGTVDCLEVVQAAIDAAYVAGTQVRIYHPRGPGGGRYRFSSYLRPYRNVELCGDGWGATTLLFDDAADGGGGSVPSDAASVNSIYAYDPWHATEYALNAAPVYGAKAVRLASAGDIVNFAAGEMIQIYSTAFTNSTATDTPFAPFVTVVAETRTSGGNGYLLLHDGIPYDFSTGGGTVKVRKRSSSVVGSGVKNIDGIKIRDLTVSVGDGAGAEMTPRNRQRAILLQGAQDAVVERVKLTRHMNRGIDVVSCRNVFVQNSHVDLLLSSRPYAESGGDGCPVEIYDSNLVHVVGSTFTRNAWGGAAFRSQRVQYDKNIISGRPGYPAALDPATDPTAIDTGVTDAARYIGRGIKFTSCINSTLEGNQITDVGAVGIMCINSRNINIENNLLDSTGCIIDDHAIDVIDSGATGLSVDCRIVGNSVRNCAGVGIAAANTAGAYGRHAITGNTVFTVHAAGIVALNSSGNVIGDNTVSNCAQQGILLSGASTQNTVVGNHVNTCVTGGIVLTDNNCTRNVVQANVIANCATDPLRTDASGGGNLVANNLVTTGTTTLDTLDEPIKTATLIADVSITSATFAALPSPGPQQVTIFCMGTGTVKLTWTGTVQPDAAGNLSLAFGVDGVAGFPRALVPGGSGIQHVAMHQTVVVGFGSHTFSLMASISTGTGFVKAGTYAVADLTAEDSRW